MVHDEKGTLEAPSDKQIDALFAMIDRNGDGEVTKSELKTGMATIGIVFHDSDINRMWRKSHDNTGTLSREEFTAMIREYGF